MRCAEYLDAEDMEHYELILASPDSAARYGQGSSVTN